MRRAGVTAVAVGLLLLAGCLPTEPSAGRGTPVHRVLVVGDSLTYGLFGVTPRLHEKLAKPMADRGIQLVVAGGAGDSPLAPWPGNPRWADLLRGSVADLDPDMIVLQATTFPYSADAGRQAEYLAAITEVLDIATSRGAHVYLVANPAPPGPDERDNRDVAQSLQAQAAAGRGISTIPLDWWLAHCANGTGADGWHLSDAGQRCHALAIILAVDQLRARNGPR